MKHKVYAVYDSKVEAYLVPFLMKSRGESLREFTTAVNSKESKLNAHPADFTLFEIGDWDGNEGSYAMYDSKINLGTALEFIND